MKPNPLSKLTAAQKRVAIAKDVLKHIGTGKLKIRQGRFVSAPCEINQANLLAAKKPCTVCAVGAAIVSGIRLFNVYTVDDCEIGEPYPLRRWFTPDQTRLIEIAFERGAGWYHISSHLHDKDSMDAFRFSKRFGNHINRAIAIFKNIIKNKGQFIP